MQPTNEELSILGTDSPHPTMTDRTVYVGASGRTYRAVNLFTEMYGDQEAALTKILAPILPALSAAVAAASASSTGQSIDSRMFLSVDYGAIATVFVGGLDRRFVATLFLPEDDRQWPEDEQEAEAAVRERIADLKRMNKQQVLDLVLGFFIGVPSSFRATFPDFLGMMATTKTALG